MGESCKWSSFRICVPMFLFKRYLKTLVLVGGKQSTLWRMSDSSNISPTPSHTGNRMYNNWYKFVSILIPRARLAKAGNSENSLGKRSSHTKIIEKIMSTTQSNRFSFNILSFLYTAWDVEKQQCLEEWSVETYWGGDLKRTKYICSRINSNTQEEAANALEWAVKWNRKFFPCIF